MRWIGAGTGLVVAAAIASAAAGDVIVLRHDHLEIRAIRIEAVSGGRVWYRADHGGREGSVPLADVVTVRFAELPELDEAESRAAAGDPAGAIDCIRPAISRRGPAGRWAAGRALDWLAHTDPASGWRLLVQRLRVDGDPAWLERWARARRDAGDGRVDEAAAADLRRLDRRIRGWVDAEADPATRRGLAGARRAIEATLKEPRASAPSSDRPGRAAGLARESEPRGPYVPAPGRTDAESVHAWMLGEPAPGAGGAERVLAAMRMTGAPSPSNFGPRQLIRYAALATEAGAPEVAAAAWLRCLILHPESTEAPAAREAAARVHEDVFGDHAAAARIRAWRGRAGESNEDQRVDDRREERPDAIR